MKKDIAIFLFSKSFTIAAPWAHAGVDCHLFDMKHDADYGHHFGGFNGSIVAYGGRIQDQRKRLGYLCRENNVLIIGSFPPCTDVAISGAKHFEKKALNDAMVWAKSMELYYHGVLLADFFNIPYFSENPMSMISTLDRKPDFKFHPYEYGGYLSESHQNRMYPDIYPSRDAYKKETWIWTGNGFVMPTPIPVVPVSDDYPGWSRLGGKSERTKEIRSTTPEGFSNAVFEANYELSIKRLHV